MGRPDPLEGLELVSSSNRVSDLVVVLSIDGLRPDAINASSPVLQQLRQNGASAPVAKTIKRSNTLPSHASMVSGVDEDLHGMVFNAYRPERGHIRFPTMFRIAHASGLETAMFVAKKKLVQLAEPGAVDSFNLGGVRCQRVAGMASEYIGKSHPGVVFVHFSEPDGAGHKHGWMSWQYKRAVRQVDACTQVLLDAISKREDSERVLFVVTADHGGHGHAHSSGVGVDRLIPWIAYGSVVNPKRRIGRTVHTFDTAATVLHALGLPRAHGTIGEPVTEVFKPIAIAASTEFTASTVVW